VKTLRLGLIGGNITETRSAALQIICGLSIGRNVTYDLLIPQEQGLSFEQMLGRCEAAGFDGVNVTYPYKEEVLKFVEAGEAVASALGASNTICFSTKGTTAWNTDHTGFIAAWRATWANAAPGQVMMLGAGGVGRAVAFALADLGASEIFLHDPDAGKASALANAVQEHAATRMTLIDANRVADLSGMDGVINCTPLGMAGRAGSALPAKTSGKPRWAFDAVYTPEHTAFRAQVEAMGADFLSGYELYFHQGIQGFRIFSGETVARTDWVRAVLKGQITV
jgi:shikimate dehydrogenase